MKFETGEMNEMVCHSTPSTGIVGTLGDVVHQRCHYQQPSRSCPCAASNLPGFTCLGKRQEAAIRAVNSHMHITQSLVLNLPSPVKYP